MARVLISMPEEFLDRIDQVAEGENRTRSELIREALRSYMYKSRVKANTMAGKNAAILELYWIRRSERVVTKYIWFVFTPGKRKRENLGK